MHGASSSLRSRIEWMPRVDHEETTEGHEETASTVSSTSTPTTTSTSLPTVTATSTSTATATTTMTATLTATASPIVPVTSETTIVQASTGVTAGKLTAASDHQLSVVAGVEPAARSGVEEHPIRRGTIDPD